MDPSSVDFAISHNREGLELAESLLIRLEATGLAGWIDSRAFYSPLISAERQIERAFRKARFLCLLVGDSYRDSSWCREEYSLGLRSEADLSITRVLVVIERSTAKALVPEALKHAPRFNWASDIEIQKCATLISNGKNASSQLAEWLRRTQDRSGLVSRLPKDERIKLVGDHLEYLWSNFDNEMVDPRNYPSALRLGLTAGPPGTHVAHASPALALEMCWKWVSEIIGEYRLRKFVAEDCEADEISRLHISDIKAMFERILPIFHGYLEKAAYRRGNPPEISEADLFAIVDYVICGFLALIYKADQCENKLIKGIRDILRLVATYGSRCLAEVANYLDAGLPMIGLPEFSPLRRMRISYLLGHTES